MREAFNRMPLIPIQEALARPHLLGKSVAVRVLRKGKDKTDVGVVARKPTSGDVCVVRACGSIAVVVRLCSMAVQLLSSDLRARLCDGLPVTSIVVHRKFHSKPPSLRIIQYLSLSSHVFLRNGRFTINFILSTAMAPREKRFKTRMNEICPFLLP